MSFTDDENWIILSNKIESSIKSKIKNIGTKLKDWDIRINYGIKTGYNEAFIIDEIIKNDLISSDPKSAEIIRPILRGRNIKRYAYDFQNEWLICIPCGFSNSFSTKTRDKEQWFKEEYTSIYNYLVEKEEKLSRKRNPKSKGLYKRDDQGDYWWELRSCNYMDDFYKPKILYSEIVQEPRFYYDEQCVFYPEASSFFIIGEQLKPLVVLLNSDITFQIFKRYYAGGGLGSSGVRYKKAFLLNMPVPKLDNKSEKILTKIYDQMSSKNFVNCSIEENEAKEFIAYLYNFTKEEVDFLLDNQYS